MPSISRIRSPNERPKTTMKRLAETIGASTVCVHSLRLALDQPDQAATAAERVRGRPLLARERTDGVFH
jgi:hypothetical protein